MHVEPSENYQLNTTLGDAQWSALVPSSGGIVHLPVPGSDAGPKPFMLSMFHQLRCLDIIRRAYVYRDRQQDTPDMTNMTAISRHCLNYLRQTVLCRRNTRIERVVDPYMQPSVQPWGPLTCKDWRVVYGAVERLQEEVERV